MEKPTVILQLLLHLGKNYWKLSFKQNPDLHKQLVQVKGLKYSYTYGCLVCHPHSQQLELLQKSLPACSFIVERFRQVDTPRVNVYPLGKEQVLVQHPYCRSLFAQLSCLPALYFDSKLRGWVANLTELKLDALILELKKVAPVYLDSRLKLDKLEELAAAW